MSFRSYHGILKELFSFLNTKLFFFNTKLLSKTYIYTIIENIKKKVFYKSVVILEESKNSLHGYYKYNAINWKIVF